MLVVQKTVGSVAEKYNFLDPHTTDKNGWCWLQLRQHTWEISCIYDVVSTFTMVIILIILAAELCTHLLTGSGTINIPMDFSNSPLGLLVHDGEECFHIFSSEMKSHYLHIAHLMING